MAHLEKDDLYALFYALANDHALTKPAFKLSGELETAVARFRKTHGSKLTAPPSQLTAERVDSVIKHIKNCKACNMLAVEDGPDAARPKTPEEIGAEEDAQREEQEQLVRKFWFSATYAVVCLFAALSCQTYYFLNVLGKSSKSSGPTIEAVNQPSIHPIQILSMVLIFFVAWGGATCWQIARENWMDTLRLKKAVPIIGYAWAARTQRKRREKELKEQKNA